jgi:hypothetical protein
MWCVVVNLCGPDLPDAWEQKLTPANDLFDFSAMEILGFVEGEWAIPESLPWVACTPFYLYDFV